MSEIQQDNSLEFLRTSFESTAPTINSLINQYLYYAENVRGMATSTLKGRGSYLRQFHEYLILHHVRDVSQITNMDLDIYFVELSKRVSVHTGRQLTTGTVNTSKRAVKGFLTWCLTYLEMPLKVKIKEIRERRRDEDHPEILTHRQISRVIKKTRNRQDKLIISVMYEAGLRISEVADMKIEHLRGRTLGVVGKGKKFRSVYITPKLAKELHTWMDYNGWEEGFVFRPQMHGDGETGYTHTDTIRARIKKLFTEIEGLDMHPHLIRHAFAIRLMENGCGLRSIQKLLGHSRIETTMIYLDISDDYLEKEYTNGFGGSVYA